MGMTVPSSSFFMRCVGHPGLIFRRSSDQGRIHPRHCHDLGVDRPVGVRDHTRERSHLGELELAAHERETIDDVDDIRLDGLAAKEWGVPAGVYAHPNKDDRLPERRTSSLPCAKPADEADVTAKPAERRANVGVDPRAVILVQGPREQALAFDDL